MELSMDLRQPVPGTVNPIEPSHLWVLGLAAVDDGRLAGPGGLPSSYWAECECPDDCLRDHENE